MKSLKGSKTEKNLMAAFAGESQARNRYTYFASKAKEEGYIQISLIFEETANQEKEHAKRMFKFMEGGEVAITRPSPSASSARRGTTSSRRAAGENHEWKSMYPDIAKTAREEGFDAIGDGLRRDRRRREAAREALREARRQYRRGQGIQVRQERRLALPELRLPLRGDGSPQGLPRLRPSSGLLRAPRRELVREGDMSPKAAGIQVRFLRERRRGPPRLGLRSLLLR